MRTYLFLFLLLSATLSAQTTWYVNGANTGGAQTGTTWATAYTDLQQALTAAQPGDRIWVAAGTYTPTTGADRSVSFVLKNKVKLYGGFAGNESFLEQRDWTTNETVLSGEIGAPTDKSDNTRHVVYGMDLEDETLLDGFTITAGYADGTTDIPSDGWGGGMLLESGFIVEDSKPLIRNCRFADNFAYIGGAVCNSWNFVYPVNPDFEHCIFEDNSCWIYGGAVFYEGPATGEKPVNIRRCTFARNIAKYGGALAFKNPAKETNITNCIFESDSTYVSGIAGGIYFSGQGNFTDTYNLKIDSCLFNKIFGDAAGAVYVEDYYLTNFETTYNVAVTNTKFLHNISHGQGPALYLYPANFTHLNLLFENSIIDSNYTVSSYCCGIRITPGGFNQIINVVVQNSVFTNNKIIGLINGGTSFVLDFTGGKIFNTSIYNCVFANNSGGISVLGSKTAKYDTHITNCTFFDNHLYAVNKTWYPEFDGVNAYNNCYITNCVIWHPESNSYKLFFNNDYMNGSIYDYHIDYSILSIPDFLWLPGFFEAYGDSVIWATNPQFVDSLQGDFRLKTCSPAVNKGYNPAVDSAGLTADLAGLPRIRHGRVDLGAYETQDSCFMVGSVLPVAAPIVCYPNPSSGRLQVEGLPGHGNGCQTEIYDAVGRLVHRTEASFPLNLSWLPPGQYRVKCRKEQLLYEGWWVKE